MVDGRGDPTVTATISVSGNITNRSFLQCSVQRWLADTLENLDFDKSYAYKQGGMLLSQIDQQCFLSVGLLDDRLRNGRHVTRLRG